MEFQLLCVMAAMEHASGRGWVEGGKIKSTDEGRRVFDSIKSSFRCPARSEVKECIAVMNEENVGDVDDILVKLAHHCCRIVCGEIKDDIP